jgi:hypothetical protein
VIERDVEEALDLAGVEVHRQRAIGAGRGDQVGRQLGGDRRARLGLAVLPGVAEVRDDRDDRPGRRALERVDHDQQLHQRLVRRRARGLDDEAVHAADVLADLDVDLAVGEVGHVGAAQRDLDELAHLLGQRPVRVSREDRQ